MSGPGRERPAGKSDSLLHEFVDLYEVLEISPRASQDVVQAAYRALARSYHPDVNVTTDAASRIRQVNEAYDVLSDPQTRARYDLECARMRRTERMAHSDRDPSAAGPTGLGHTRAVAIRPVVSRVRGEHRSSIRLGQTVLLLICVALVAAFLLAIILLSLDESGNSSSVYSGPSAELTHPDFQR